MGSGLSTSLQDRSLHDETVERLTEIVRRMKAQDRTLTTLDLSNNFVGAHGAKIAQDSLAYNRTITDLDLSYNNLGGSGRRGRMKQGESEETLGIASISAALCKNNTLMKINLAGNNLAQPGTRWVSKMLQNTNSIQKLSLFNNFIDDSSIDDICEALAVNGSLTSLNLDYNDITDVGAEKLANVLSKNTSIVELSLRNNDGVSERWVKEIERAADGNKSVLAAALAEKEKEQRRQKEAAEAEEAARQKKELVLKSKRENVEREYAQLQAERDRIDAARDAYMFEKETKRQMKEDARLMAAREREDHTQNLIYLAYAWRQTLRGGQRRGREWRSGFTSVKDTDYEQTDTYEPPQTADQHRRLRACWCEPTEQTVQYAGQLHYHCLHEAAGADQFDDSKSKRYSGCLATAHRCRSAPIAENIRKREKDTLFGNAVGMTE